MFRLQNGRKCMFHKELIVECWKKIHPRRLPSLKLTFSPLKMNSWKTFSFPFGKPYFQVRTVSFREGNIEPENRGLVMVQMIFLLHGCILRFHVHLPGCMNKIWTKKTLFQLGCSMQKPKKNTARDITKLPKFF